MNGQDATNRRSARYGSAVLAALALTVASGCASTKPDSINPDNKCQGASSDDAVTINFDESGCPLEGGIAKGSADCPPGEGPGTLCTHRGKWVRWRATQNNENFAVKYDIYFDPFQGNTIQSNNQGCAKAKIDPDAPLSAYKYTVVVKNPDCKPFDPRVIVSP